MERQTAFLMGMVVCALAAAVFTAGAWLLSRRADKRPPNTQNKQNKLPQVICWLWFVMYLLLLAHLTVTGRGELRVPHWNRELLAYYLRDSFNLIPGHMIIDMILSAWNGSISPQMCLVNIFGNLAALMPTAFFLPRLFPKQFGTRRQWKAFALTVTGMVAVIECTQFLTWTGTFDIDDFILNVSGACAAFLLLQRKT